MVFESIISPMAAEKRPWQMFFLGMLYSTIGIFLSIWIFREHASLLMVFLTVFAAMPIMYNTIRLEEKRDEEADSDKGLLKQHARALEVFIFLFLGFTISMTIWFLIFSTDFAAGIFGADLSTELFKTQTTTIQNINSPATGNVAKLDYFSRVFFNNTKVLMFCLLFSFVYGLGAIFILTWNASVIAAAIGSYIKLKLASLGAGFSMAMFGQYFHIYSCGFFIKYWLHGILEILAYFMAGLAGGIISVAVIRHTFGTKKFSTVLLDSADLILVSIFILFIAGLTEAYISPNLISVMMCPR